MWMITSFLQKSISFLFPSSCFLCKQKETSLCLACLATLQPALSTPHPFIMVFFSFKDAQVRKILHAGKYYHRKDILLTLTNYAITHNKEDLVYPPDSLCIPLPMPRLREYVRGYNQAECIAKECAKLLNLNYSQDTLLRKKYRKRQVKTSSRKERFTNQKNSFIVAQPVTGKTCILIDDITTTGGTLLEARKTLFKAGAKEVYALVLAH